MGYKHETAVNPLLMNQPPFTFQGCRSEACGPRPDKCLVADDGSSFFSCGSDLFHPIIRAFSM